MGSHYKKYMGITCGVQTRRETVGMSIVGEDTIPLLSAIPEIGFFFDEEVTLFPRSTVIPSSRSIASYNSMAWNPRDIILREYIPYRSPCSRPACLSCNFLVRKSLAPLDGCYNA